MSDRHHNFWLLSWFHFPRSRPLSLTRPVSFLIADEGATHPWGVRSFFSLLFHVSVFVLIWLFMHVFRLCGCWCLFQIVCVSLFYSECVCVISLFFCSHFFVLPFFPYPFLFLHIAPCFSLYIFLGTPCFISCCSFSFSVFISSFLSLYSSVYLSTFLSLFSPP